MISNKNLLVTAADQKYLLAAKLFFINAYQNSGWSGDYMLLAHDIPDSDLLWFTERGILIKKCPALIDSLPDRWPPVVLDKFYLFSSEFKQWQHIIYLDSDMLIQASLEKLTQITGLASLNIDPFFKRTYLRDYFNYESPNFNQSLFKQIEETYHLDSLGFSGGLLAFNSDLIDQDLFKRMTNLIPILNFSQWGEEAILNLVFNQRWQRLARPYNLSPDIIQDLCGIKPSQQKALIFHLGPKVLEQSLNPEQVALLEQAGKFNLNNRPKARAVWSDWLIVNYQLYLYLRYLIYRPYHYGLRLLGYLSKYGRTTD